MSGPLHGKNAIVTGGAGGMGRSHALRLARLGANVAIFDLKLDIAHQWGEELTADTVPDEIRAFGVEAHAVEVDLVDAVATTSAVDEVVERWEVIDILVNNAGGAVTPFERSTASTTTDEDARRVIEVNLLTTVNCCRAVVPHLRRPGATIVNISTIGVDREVAGGRLALYGAAKAAVVRYTRSLAFELGPEGIRVNALAPGQIDTARIRALSATRPGIGGDTADLERIALRRVGSPDDISAVVEFLTGDLSAYVTGECIRVGGGSQIV